MGHVNNSFSFQHVTDIELRKEIRAFSSKKSRKTGGIFVIILKFPIETYLPELSRIFDNLFDKMEYLDELKLVEMPPSLKKQEALDKTSNRPISFFYHICQKFMRDQSTNK